MTHRTYYECEDGTVIADEIMDGDIHTGMNVRFTKPFKTSDPDWKKRIQSQAKAKGVTARFRTGKWKDGYSSPSGWSSPPRRLIAEFTF